MCGALKSGFRHLAYAIELNFLQDFYKEEPFVHVLAKGQIPHTRHVRGSNFNLISVFEDRLSGRAIIVSGKQSATFFIDLQDFSHKGRQGYFTASVTNLVIVWTKGIAIGIHFLAESTGWGFNS